MPELAMTTKGANRVELGYRVTTDEKCRKWHVSPFLSADYYPQVSIIRINKGSEESKTPAAM